MDDQHGPNQAGGIYGTLLVLAVIAIYTKDRSATSTDILESVLGTALVFWLAHVYVEVIAERATVRRGRFWHRVRVTGRREWPIAESALLPAAALLVGAIGVLGRPAAVTIAFVLGLLDLVGWGLAIGRRMRLSRWGTLLVATGTCAFGLLVVALKALLH